MDVQTIALLIGGGSALGVMVWALAKIGRVLIKIAEAVAAAAAVFIVLWLMIKAVVWALRQTLTHWRTSLMGTQSSGAWRKSVRGLGSVGHDGGNAFSTQWTREDP